MSFQNFVFPNSGLMQIIFEKLSLANLTQSNPPLLLKIVQKYETTNNMYQDPNYGANFTITIGNMKQMNYARYILEFDKTISRRE